MALAVPLASVLLSLAVISSTWGLPQPCWLHQQEGVGKWNNNSSGRIKIITIVQPAIKLWRTPWNISVQQYSNTFRQGRCFCAKILQWTIHNFIAPGNNGYNIDNIVAPALTIDYHNFQKPSNGIASMTPPPPVALATAITEALGTTNDWGFRLHSVELSGTARETCCSLHSMSINKIINSY